MALHWAWAFAIDGSYTDYVNSSWTLTGVPNMASTAAMPRNPPPGYGGMTRSVYMSSYNGFRTATFPQGSLADGIVQFNYYRAVQGDFEPLSEVVFSLYSSADVLLLQIRPTSTGTMGASTLTVYSGEGVMVSRGVTTELLRRGTWHTIGVRLQIGVGQIDVTIDGVSALSLAGDTQVASNWAKIQCLAGYYGTAVTGFSVWDNPADDALTVPRFIPSLRPVRDVDDGAWVNTAVPPDQVNLYAYVDEDPPSTADYITTTTDPDEVHLGLETDDINANWAPSAIDGVEVIPMMRGDGTLNAGQAAIDDGVNNLLGTIQATNLSSSFLPNDMFPLQADGVTAWTKAALESNSFGVRAS